MGRLKIRKKAVQIAPRMSSREKELPITRSASSRSPWPRQMEKMGPPPVPHRLAKPMMMDTMGMVTPKPVRARWLLPGRRPR